MLVVSKGVSWGGMTMKNLIILLCVLVVSAGCRDGQFIKDNFTSSTCGISFSGYTATVVHYGDSRLFVLPISKIRPDTEFRFRLLPKVRKTDPPVDYRDAFVSITSDDDDLDTPANWLDVSGTLNANGNWLVTCVPAAAGLTQSRYKYKVTVSWPGVAAVDTLGYLDPRADIIIDVN